MEQFIEFIILLLSQVAGGPGPVENNLVRFGLPAVMWAILFIIAFSRQRTQDLPREKLLVWGFGLAFLRELYMFVQMSRRLLASGDFEASCKVVQPFEHALAMAAMILVAGAFLRYCLEDPRIAKRYIQIGISITVLVYLFSSLTWPQQLAANPIIKFHHTWSAWLFHIPLTILMAAAVFLLWREKSWLRNVVAGALTLELLSEIMLLINYATDQAYNTVLCPIGNSLHILAIPLLGYIYLREQSIEKKQAEDALKKYRDHLKELVSERTAELTAVNTQLQQEVFDRTQAEQALERISQRDELILETAGEGICGIDRQGLVTFANPAAARMLGYSVEELINRPCHAIWHRSQTGHQPHSLEECPIYQGYNHGIQRFGDDEYFSSGQDSAFPARYFSNPTWENGELTGAVVVFQDITERKRSEAEIAQHNASLAMQNAVAATLSQSLEIEENLSKVLEMLQTDAVMEIGLIFLLDPDNGKLRLQLHNGLGSVQEIKAFTAEKCACQLVSHQALVQKQPASLNSNDIPEAEQAPCRDLAGIRSLISVPLISKGQAVGVLTLGTKRTAVLEPYKLELLTAICQQIGMAIENANLYQEAENWVEQLNQLNEASSFLTASLDRDQVTKEISRQSARLLKCNKTCILYLNGNTVQPQLEGCFGFKPDERQVLQEQLSNWDFLQNLAVQPKTTAIRDASTDKRLPEVLKKKLDLRAALLVPIWSSEDPKEFIVLIDTQTTRHWSANELELIERLAIRAAIALVNANLHHQLELSAALEERQRIAANMHDGLAQTLSLLGLRMDRIQELARNGNSSEVDQSIREARDVLASASSEVRRSIASLQEAPRPPVSLQDSLKNLLANLQTMDRPEIQFYSEPLEAVFVPPEQSDQILHIVQEVVINACYHAQAQIISIHLQKSGSDFCITVEDDGIGFDLQNFPQKKDHFGLSIMQARAAHMDGDLRIDTSPGKGTRITLSWNLEPRRLQNPILS